jgi:hypothetical protein
VSAFKPLIRREIVAVPAGVPCPVERDISELPLPGRATGFDRIAVQSIGEIIGIILSYKTIDVNKILLENE